MPRLDSSPLGLFRVKADGELKGTPKVFRNKDLFKDAKSVHIWVMLQCVDANAHCAICIQIWPINYSKLMVC